MIFVTDKKRHLICVPYSIENLHLMAEQLGIKKCWFHKNHYDIPKGMIEEVEKKCRIVSPKNIVEIIRNPKYGHIIISDGLPEMPTSRSVTYAKPADHFWQTQIDYNGN